MKRHHKKLKIGKIIRPRTYSPLTVKAFEEGKDNPDHILGIAHRDSKTDDLYVIDRTTGIKIMILQVHIKA